MIAKTDVNKIRDQDGHLLSDIHLSNSWIAGRCDSSCIMVAALFIICLGSFRAEASL